MWKKICAIKHKHLYVQHIFLRRVSEQNFNCTGEGTSENSIVPTRLENQLPVSPFNQIMLACSADGVAPRLVTAWEL